MHGHKFFNLKYKTKYLSAIKYQSEWNLASKCADGFTILSLLRIQYTKHYIRSIFKQAKYIL